MESGQHERTRMLPGVRIQSHSERPARLNYAALYKLCAIIRIPLQSQEFHSFKGMKLAT